MRMEQSSQGQSQQTSSGDDEVLLTSSDTALDKKPSANVSDSGPPEGKKKKPRKKRRAPLIPWKKPKDMPKRPLSAYNLFFRSERERILNAGLASGSAECTEIAESQQRASDNETIRDNSHKSFQAQKIELSSASDEYGKSKKTKPRRHLKSSGIGFANLAKTIAAKWKEIDPETRSTFESLAVKEKEKYQKAMEIWRSKKSAIPEKRKEENETSPDSKKSSCSSSEGEASEAVAAAEAPANQESSENSFYGGTPPHEFHEHSTPPHEVHGHSPPHEYHEHTLQLDDFPSPASSLGGSDLQYLIDDVRSCEAIAADQRNQIRKSVVQSSLEALDAQLDEESADFLTNLKFE